MTWINASVRAFAIVLYFVVFTVWLPDFVLGLGFVSGGSDLLRDLAVSAVWGAAMVVGMVGLRLAQRRGLV
ncbi:MAG TPA: hypothetical protein VFY15_06415 [Acidimicrobiia bacterium]|nr:hypothetical protein [Acidimicrobiia bacterium]